MTNRIDKLRTQAVDYVEKQESISKQQSDNALDKGLVAELLTGISDDDAIESIEKHDIVLDSDANTIQENLSENAEAKTEAISDADEYLSVLEDNLSKIKQINQASDLVKNTSAESSTKKRMSELQEIKKLLGEEAQISTHESSVKTTSSERVEVTNEKSDSAEKYLDNTELRVANTLSDITEYASFESVKQYHANAERIANNNMLKFFKAHDLEGHIAKVIEKTIEAASVIEEITKTKLDRQDLLLASLYHDTGMDGGNEYNDEKEIRTNHSLISALHILENRSKIETDGGDADKIALLAFLHSKNKGASDVNNLNDNTQIKKAIEKLSQRIGKLNANKSSAIYFIDKKFDSISIEKIKNNATALRFGDAFGHDSSSDKTQNGGRMVINPDSANLNAGKWEEEIVGAKLEYYNMSNSAIPIGNKNDPSGHTRMYQFGEGNINNMRSQIASNGEYEAIIEIRNGNSFPLCTQECIRERIKELETAPQFDRTMTIIIYSNGSSQKNNEFVQNSYNLFVEKAEKEYYPIKFNVIYKEV